MFGSPISGRIEETVHELFAPFASYAHSHGFAELLTAIPGLLDRLIRSEDFGRIAEVRHEGNWDLRPEVLFPDAAKASPHDLFLVRGENQRQVSASMPPSYWPRVHALIASLESGDCNADDPSLHPDMRSMLDAMRKEDLVAEANPCPEATDLHGADLTFVGHSCVVIRSRDTRIVIDPVWFPGASTYPDGYQPLLLRDVGPVDAILITHSHPDHFGPSSLLRFPSETRIIVPLVERETLLSVDMVLRLRQLGFLNITALPWGTSTQVGDIEVRALPFYGEQPTDGPVLHPSIRNVGNTYLIRTPDFSAVFLADSGRDSQGDVRDLATQARANFGSVDVVFCGYRGWSLYPPHYLYSSVPQYLLFVPPLQWGVRQQIMARSDEAIDVAERWGAKYLIPYSDGGAPWHWELGLGPRLDGEGIEMPEFDPFPERVIDAARNRTQSPTLETLSSAVRVVILRPGDSLDDVGGEPRFLRVPGHNWPYT
jgi:L-ascorbate metabolism protein UlaG (beta-lactamase superfamily)